MSLNEADMGPERAERGGRKAPRPLTGARLEEMALAYVARFATSAGKLEAYLARKLRERGWDGEGQGAAAITTLIVRFAELGYIDDAGFARMRSGSLLRRGYGARRIAQDLSAAGIEDAIRQDCVPDEAEARRAVLAMARRKGFGPFTRGIGPDQPIDPALRERQMASLLRAGHGMAQARALLALREAEDAQRWAEEAEEGGPEGGDAGRGFWD